MARNEKDSAKPFEGALCFDDSGKPKQVFADTVDSHSIEEDSFDEFILAINTLKSAQNVASAVLYKAFESSNEDGKAEQQLELLLGRCGSDSDLNFNPAQLIALHRTLHYTYCDLLQNNCQDIPALRQSIDYFGSKLGVKQPLPSSQLELDAATGNELSDLLKKSGAETLYPYISDKEREERLKVLGCSGCDIDFVWAKESEGPIVREAMAKFHNVFKLGYPRRP